MFASCWKVVEVVVVVVVVREKVYVHTTSPICHHQKVSIHPQQQTSAENIPLTDTIT
jgi:hypothetical protein